MEAVESVIAECGFDSRGECDADRLSVRPEVRSMCRSDLCKNFDGSWSCPPACGDIESFQDRFQGYERCYVVQTVAELEDEFDIETMMEAAEAHKERMALLSSKIAQTDTDAYVLSAGGCTLCPECTYPDAPCRFPDKMLVSMEAAGLLVSDVCTMAGVPYNHGKNTIAYTGCVLA